MVKKVIGCLPGDHFSLSTPRGIEGLGDTNYRTQPSRSLWCDQARRRTVGAGGKYRTVDQ